MCLSLSRSFIELLKNNYISPSISSNGCYSPTPNLAFDLSVAWLDSPNRLTTLEKNLRRAVVDTALGNDFRKGLALASRAGDFNSFSWGPREWMKADPAAVVQELATLPSFSSYRSYLKYALSLWVQKDPPATLAWMSQQPSLKNDSWLGDGFIDAAKADPKAALAAASAITDPKRLDTINTLPFLDLSTDLLKNALHQMPVDRQIDNPPGSHNSPLTVGHGPSPFDKAAETAFHKSTFTHLPHETNLHSHHRLTGPPRGGCRQA